MDHAIELLIRVVGRRIFYWIGFLVIKAVSLGGAIAGPYWELGDDEDAAWWELRMRRDGVMFWRPEGLIIVGGCSILLAIGIYCWIRYF